MEAAERLHGGHTPTHRHTHTQTERAHPPSLFAVLKGLPTHLCKRNFLSQDAKRRETLSFIHSASRLCVCVCVLVPYTEVRASLVRRRRSALPPPSSPHIPEIAIVETFHQALANNFALAERIQNPFSSSARSLPTVPRPHFRLGCNDPLPKLFVLLLHPMWSPTQQKRLVKLGLKEVSTFMGRSGARELFSPP